MSRNLFVLAAVSAATFACSSESARKSETSTTTFAMDECGLHTAYKGDENCILPPPPDKGFQLHVGPTDYDNPESVYVMQPGDEFTDSFPAVSGNDQDVFFFFRQYRVRPTAHHMIITAMNEADGGAATIAGLGRRIGTANRSEDYPSGGNIAPEDRSVGLPLSAHSNISVSFHTINAGDTPELRELWVNFWYRDPSEVTQPAVEWFNGVDLSLVVPARSTKTLGPYSCNVDAPGRLLWLYGHRHANNVRFTVTRVRGAQRDVIYDAYKWEEPLLLEYSSTVTNRAPDIGSGIEGGWNGILDLAAGDRVEWACDVVNKLDTDLHFTNNTFTGEMCIIDAEAVGSACSGM